MGWTNPLRIRGMSHQVTCLSQAPAIHPELLRAGDVRTQAGSDLWRRWMPVWRTMEPWPRDAGGCGMSGHLLGGLEHLLCFWLVWLPFLAFSYILGISSSQLTFIFSEGFKPPTRFFSINWQHQLGIIIPTNIPTDGLILFFSEGWPL